MSADKSRNNQRERRPRELLIFLVILLLGFICLTATARFAMEMAIRPARTWEEEAAMESEIDPDTGEEPEVDFDPLRPEVLTPPPWDPDTLLTPVGDPTLVPPVVFASPTGTPQEIVQVTPTSPATEVPTRTPVPTPTSTETPTPLPTPTSTFPPPPTDTPTPTPTWTPVPPPTNTPVPPPTNTPVPPPTNTPVPLPPQVLWITPDTAVNTAIVAVTIGGANFFPGCTAALDGTALTISSCNPTTIVASVPAGLLAGYYGLTVTNPGPLTDTLASAYTATNPIPVITGIVPTLWFTTTDTPITIYGSSFTNLAQPATGALRANMNGISLLNVTLVSPTTITATVPCNSNPMALGAYTLNVINAGPTNPTGSLVNGFRVDTYTNTVTCSGGAVSCAYAVGPPDDLHAGIPVGEVITISFGAGQGISTTAGHDMVFYERANAPGILLDYVTIEVSTDGSTWYTVFNWDGNPGGVSGTNIDSYAASTPGEEDNEPILSSDLYPFPGTGIMIDIQAFGAPAGVYDWVRLSNPGGIQPSEVDAIQPLY